VAIVWPCPLAVDAYAASGRDVGFPRPACPCCAGPLVFWSGYRRYVRAAARCRKIFVPRLRCAVRGEPRAGPAGTFRQTTEPGKPQRDILTALGLDPPKKIIEISPKP
jgi:hypothetical protein